MTPCSDSPPPALLKGIAQFNRGEFFEQHETLEELWRAEARPVRELYRGILQIGVAFHHLRRLNYHGVVYMLSRGRNYLRPFAPVCQGVDVAHLIAAATRALEEAERLGPARLAEFDSSLVPRVNLVAGDPR
jgi:predicted metal-dependent hydrolase